MSSILLRIQWVNNVSSQRVPQLAQNTKEFLTIPTSVKVPEWVSQASEGLNEQPTILFSIYLGPLVTGVNRDSVNGQLH